MPPPRLLFVSPLSILNFRPNFQRSTFPSSLTFQNVLRCSANPVWSHTPSTNSNANPGTTSRPSSISALTALHSKRSKPAKYDPNGYGNNQDGGTGGGSSDGGRRGDGGGGGGDEDARPRRLFSAYMRLLEQHALKTKIATSAILTLLSDLIAQTFENGGKGTYDLRRLFALFMVGGLLTAPMFHLLYGALEKYIPAGAGWGNVAMQLAVDQLLAAPVWLWVFFGGVAFFEGTFEWDKVKRQVDRDFVPSMKLTWTVFPPVQLASFVLLKPSLRVLALNVVDLGYTTILSYIKHQPQAGAVEREKG